MKKRKRGIQMKVTELAPAKQNHTLEVGEKRSDGYREVQSVMF